MATNLLTVSAMSKYLQQKAAAAKAATTTAPAPSAAANLLRSGYLVGAASSTPVGGAALPAASGSGLTPAATTPTPAPAPATTTSSNGLPLPRTVKSMLQFAGLATATSAGARPTTAADIAPTKGQVAIASTILTRAPSGLKIAPTSPRDQAAFNAAAAQLQANAAGSQATAQAIADARAAQQRASQSTPTTSGDVAQDHPLGSRDPVAPSYTLVPNGDTSTPAATDTTGSSGSMGMGAALALGALFLLLFARKH